MHLGNFGQKGLLWCKTALIINLLFLARLRVFILTSSTRNSYRPAIRGLKITAAVVLRRSNDYISL